MTAREIPDSPAAFLEPLSVDALEARLRELEPARPNPMLDAYAKVVDAITSTRPVMELRFDKDSHLERPGRTPSPPRPAMLTGNQIKAARVLAGAAQVEIAATAGVTRQTLVRLEASGAGVVKRRNLREGVFHA